MNKWMIILAGPVVFGACSMKRHTERTQTASTRISAHEAGAYRYLDSLETTHQRSLHIDRRWVVDLPEPGHRMLYNERIRFGETAEVASGSTRQARTSVQRTGQAEVHSDYTSQSLAEPKLIRMGWWVGGCIAIGVGIVWRLKRFWPFK